MRGLCHLIRCIGKAVVAAWAVPVLLWDKTSIKAPSDAVDLRPFKSVY